MADSPSPQLAPYAGTLRVRVCGICLEQEKLLVVRHGATVGNTAFWAPPGGGITYGEQVKTGLVREVQEETGLHVEVGAFLGIYEFIGDPLHAIELFFLTHLVGGQLQTGTDPEVPAERQLIQSVHWLSLPELQQLNQTDLHPFLQNLTAFQDLLRVRNQFK